MISITKGKLCIFAFSFAMPKIELLAPAKNLESGQIAINYGADAVYIGAESFGARAAASNSIADIEKLVLYAHKYQAKVFVALNTILYDHELQEAEKLIHKIYQAGADALIIQDMGILKMNIPPIALHASTQTNNYDPDRIHFFDEIGFERIVLARELALPEIQAIRKQTKVDLEFFVHGALCVSLSGQCYFSQTITGRSANRGMCAQMCRHPYNLLDAKGNKLKLNSHLLSLKDLNLSNELRGLLDAGITSLKIEGRLKDTNYVKNVVSYYRQKLDEIINSVDVYQKASSGSTEISFTPDPERSFNRQSSTYFINQREQGQVNTASPKSMGKQIGAITHIGRDYIKTDAQEVLHNGDGLCFILDDQLFGLRVERVIDNKIFVSELSKLEKGLMLYRNHDHEFNKQLEADQSIRKVAATINITEEGQQLHFQVTDEDGLSTVIIQPDLPELAKDATMASKNIIAQLSKSGSSMFNITEVKIHCEKAYFFRISELNEIRRILFEKLEALRIETFAAQDFKVQRKTALYPKASLDFSENIANAKAMQFYKESGVEEQEKALEISSTKEKQLLMTTRYCIKYELGYCQRFQGAKQGPEEPLYLQDQNRKYLLDFDCKNCLMQIKLTE